MWGCPNYLSYIFSFFRKYLLLIYFLQDQFDLEGDPIDIEKAMNTQFGRRLSNYTYKLHKQFKELKDAKGEEYARNHPPKDVGPTKWIDLIDKKWNTTKFQVYFVFIIISAKT